MPKLRSLYGMANYEFTSETLSSGSGALSQKKCNHYLAVDGTDAYTLSAPKFKGQKHRITQISGANTPSCTVTVTGMKISTQNVFTFDRTTAQLDTAPRYMELVSRDGTSWDLVSMVGVTVA